MGGNSEGSLGNRELLSSLGTETNGVLSEDTLSISGSVLDAPGLSVGLEGGGLGGGEDVVSFAGAVAVRSGNPKVGGSSIQDNNEGLFRGSDGDVSDVLVVSVVEDLKEIVIQN